MEMINYCVRASRKIAEMCDSSVRVLRKKISDMHRNLSKWKK